MGPSDQVSKSCITPFPGPAFSKKNADVPCLANYVILISTTVAAIRLLGTGDIQTSFSPNPYSESEAATNRTRL